MTLEYPCLAQQFRWSIKTNNSRKYDPNKTGDSPHFLAETVPNRGVCLEVRSFNPQKRRTTTFSHSIMVQLPFQRIFMIVCCNRCNPLLWLWQSIKNLETSLRYGLRTKVTTSLQPLTTDFSGSCNLSRLQKTYPPKKKGLLDLKKLILMHRPLKNYKINAFGCLREFTLQETNKPHLGKNMLVAGRVCVIWLQYVSCFRFYWFCLFHQRTFAKHLFQPKNETNACL